MGFIAVGDKVVSDTTPDLEAYALKEDVATEFENVDTKIDKLRNGETSFSEIRGDGEENESLLLYCDGEEGVRVSLNGKSGNANFSGDLYANDIYSNTDKVATINDETTSNGSTWSSEKINVNLGGKANIHKNSRFTGKKLMIAHRGASGECPEMSIASYNWAKKFKFDAVECDVRFTSDGIPVLMHDETVDRTTDGTGYVENMTLKEIKALKIDYSSNPTGLVYYPNEQVPTLEEFLVLCKQLNMLPVIEIKGTLTQQKAMVIIDLVKKYKLLEDSIFIDFSKQNLLTMLGANNQCNCMLLCDITQSNVEWCVANNMIGIGADCSTNLSQENVELCHSNDLLVNFWTVTRNEDGIACSKYGVDMQTSNVINFAYTLNQPITEFLGIKPTNEYELDCIKNGKYIIRMNDGYHGYSPLPNKGKGRAVLCRRFPIYDKILATFTIPTNSIVTHMTVHGFFYQNDNYAIEDIGWLITDGSSIIKRERTYGKSVEGVVYVGLNTGDFSYLDLEMLYVNQVISIIPNYTSATS